jgi:hypothetical protein
LPITLPILLPFNIVVMVGRSSSKNIHTAFDAVHYFEECQSAALSPTVNSGSFSNTTAIAFDRR